MPSDSQRDNVSRSRARRAGRRGWGNPASGDPQPVGELLELITARMGIARSSDFEEVRRQWPSLVGSVWAEHSRPASISQGTLRIEVTEPGLIESFRWARRDLISAVNAVLGEEMVTEIHAISV